jgi:enoyl-CoA hydratase
MTTPDLFRRKGADTMAYENVIYEVKEQIAYVTINRPKVLNALNRETVEELYQIFSALPHNRAVRVVILTGSGDRSFVSGADINMLKELAAGDASTAKAFAERGDQLLHLIEYGRIPVIAAINGFALGGGCELAMACHLRIASEKARFGQPEINLGLFPGFGGTQRLPRLIGKGRALELILTGEMIDAQEAYRIGLVNKVTKPEELLPTTEELAKRLCAKAPIAIQLALEAVNHGLNNTLAEGLKLEASLFGLVCTTEDMREGTAAFLEKRKAAFQGR